VKISDEVEFITFQTLPEVFYRWLCLGLNYLLEVRIIFRLLLLIKTKYKGKLYAVDILVGDPLGAYAGALFSYRNSA
jgi:hypothetical protein